jgi:AcrR family transcriptional regulator
MVYSVYLPFLLVKRYTREVMPYPSKTNAQTILVAALEYLEHYGEEALSMRELASGLGLSPRALYRYYPDRAALEAAIAEEGFRYLHAALVEAVGGSRGEDALRASAAAYLAFAQAHPAWYSLLMRFHMHTPGLLQAGHEVWIFVAELLEQLVGPEKAASAAVALWAFLHGFIQLESVAILGEEKPRSGFQVGLDALLSGLTSFPT